MQEVLGALIILQKRFKVAAGCLLKQWFKGGKENHKAAEGTIDAD